MIEPTRIVVADFDLKLEADQVTGITVLAAAAMACMAAIGNGDAAKVEQIPRLAVPTYKRLSIDARDTVRTVADELVDCVLAGKMFMAHGKVRVLDDIAKRN